jgi:Pro-kumamolisin, activation domain/Bacterial Ig-like domain (group 3)
MGIHKTGLGRDALVGASLLAFSCLQAGAQTAAQTTAAQSAAEQTKRVPARVTEAVDDTNRVALSGSVHPKARAEFDRGTVADAQPITRIMLQLQRSAEQEAALRQLMEEQQSKGSANYHAWLTPADFGKKFGPADSDVQAVTDWLTSRGFQNIKVAKGKTVVEFSGNVGQVRNAFGTEIHKYNVNGNEHFANVSNPQIPAALAPVVRSVVALHNFRHEPHAHLIGTFQRTKATGEIRPLFTYTDSNGQFFGVGPADFAKIYNVPATISGTPAGQGETIAIVGRTNINIQDVRAFRTMFGLPANDPVIVLNGPDPGIVSTGEETEADLDVEWAGAVAPNATIELVVTETPQSNASDGVDLSALYIVDNNLAPVMSESFGACELSEGTAGNQFENKLWEQAAAQGITVSVSAGDNGSAGCDGTSATQTAAAGGIAVSGTASTPFNVAIGGTDFDNTLTNYPAQFWNTTNTTTTPVVPASALSYIPEVPWNDSCAAGGSLTGCATVKSDGSDLVAGSGGPSTCSIQSSSGTCLAGYPKPSWQNGPGVPADGVRDIPDVSFFASDGNHKSFYIICQSDQDPTGGSGCDLATKATSPNHNFQAVGGTSAPTPAFAGIMALINQQTNQRQGNANPVLYALAAKAGNSCTSDASAIAKTSCVFYDVNKGNNSVACQGGSPNCSSSTSGAFGILEVAGGTTPAFNATVGYDRATGLGSVNVANLIGAWASAATRTAPAITLASTTTFPIAHGTPATFTISVTPATATGDVSLIASPPGVPVLQFGLGPFPLVNGSVTFSTNLLPGGTYPVLAHYQGDGTFGISDSHPPMTVSINVEPSKTALSFVTFDATNTPTSHTGNVAVTYGSSYILRVDVANTSGTPCAGNTPVTTTSIPCPTGKVALTDNGSALNDFNNANTSTLNNQGFLEDQPIQLSAGMHNILASYAGDSSYGPSTSAATPLSVTINKATTAAAVASNLTSVVSGGSVTFTATISTTSNGAGPTGTVQFKNSSSNLGAAATCTPTAATASSSGTAFCTATLTTALSQLVPLMREPQPKLRIPGVPLWIAAWLLILFLAVARHASLQRKWPRLRYAVAGLLLFACLAAGFAGCSGTGSSSSTSSGGGAHTDSITAVYSGDANYTGSTSAAATVAIQ